MDDQVKKFNRFGFTLIELLVVIAIISIIAAILYPVFASAREKGRQSACSSNLKQIGLAFEQYEQDYDEQMPWGQTTYPTGNGIVPCIDPGGTWWMQIVTPYIGEKAGANGFSWSHNDVFICPDNNQIKDGCGGTAMTSYAINYEHNLLPMQWASQGPPVTLAKIIRPADIVLLTESFDFTPSQPTWIWPDPWFPDNNQAATAIKSLSVHSGGGNDLYVDGHVKWVPATLELKDYDDMFAENSL